MEDVFTHLPRIGLPALRQITQKRGLFNILTNRYDFSEWKVLDLFGGTGNHSYEFISRGCSDVTYVDKFRPAVEFVKKIAATLEITEYIKVVKADVYKFLDRNRNAAQFNYIFAGPPYPLPTIDTLPESILQARLLTPDGLLVMEHNPNHSFKDHPCYLEERHYGKTIFSFFKSL